MRTKTKLGLGVLGLAALAGASVWTYLKVIRPTFYKGIYHLAPSLPETTKEESKNNEGLYIGKFQTTKYHTADERNYSTWSTTGKVVGGEKACRIKEKGFYESVRCEGAGIGKNGLLYTAGSIKPERKYSKGKKTNSDCLGHTKDGPCSKIGRSIAVDPELIRLGSLVRLEFVNRDGELCKTELCDKFNGWYRAEDIGSGIKGKQIDLYTGLESGKNNHVGKNLPDQANLYLAKDPGKEDLEKILKYRQPEISNKRFIIKQPSYHRKGKRNY